MEAVVVEETKRRKEAHEVAKELAPRIKAMLLRLEEERVRTYWAVGKLIKDAVEANNYTPGETHMLLTLLEAETGYDRRFFKTCLEFAQMCGDVEEFIRENPGAAWEDVVEELTRRKKVKVEVKEEKPAEAREAPGGREEEVAIPYTFSVQEFRAGKLVLAEEVKGTLAVAPAPVEPGEEEESPPPGLATPFPPEAEEAEIPLAVCEACGREITEPEDRVVVVLCRSCFEKLREWASGQ